MANAGFILQRPPFFSMDQLVRIEEAMFRILDEVGIAVTDGEVRERLGACGFRVRDGRIRLSRKSVLAFLEAERKENGDRFSEGPLPVEAPGSGIELSVSTYPQHVHDMATDRLVPFDTDRLIEAVKLVDALADRGVAMARPPGCPADVPPPLQPIVQYWVGAICSRRGRSPVDPKSEASIPYVMAMAEALERPLRQLPVYVVSPLTLGGESLTCAIKFRDRLSAVSVSDMSSLGCTAPIHIGDAYALCAAEVVGGAMLVRELVDLPVTWSIRLCPIDLHSMAMTLGSPEDFLLQLANAEVNAYFHGRRWSPAAGSIHTAAKLPGAQACAEKASLMTAGALLGARRFSVAGTLSLDQVFSPEQLLYDVEIKDHVQRLVQGGDGDCDPERCLNDAMEGVKQQSFVGLDTTLDAHRRVYWRPALFERRFLSGWQAGGEETDRQRAHAMVRELVSRHEYEPEPDLRRELDGIVAKAKAEFGGRAI